MVYIEIMSPQSSMLAMILTVLCASLLPAGAQNLSQFTLGYHQSGPKVDLSSMKGKVVAIEFWGTR